MGKDSVILRYHLKTLLIVLFFVCIGLWIGTGDPYRRYHVRKLSNENIFQTIAPDRLQIFDRHNSLSPYRYDHKDNSLLVSYLADPTRFAAAHVALLNANSVEQVFTDLKEGQSFMVNGLFVSRSENRLSFDLERSEDLVQYWKKQLSTATKK